jgi:molecular chaperone DnaK (HSP70)
LVFWNRWSLERLNGSSEKYNGTNDETFYKFDAKTWSDAVREFDEVMNDIEKWVQTADEAELKESAQTITTICTHNAYHIGQIIYGREQGSWDPNMGVK